MTCFDVVVVNCLGATEFHCEREHQPLLLIGPSWDQLDVMLMANASRAAREKWTLILLFAELREAGYDVAHHPSFVRSPSESSAVVCAVGCGVRSAVRPDRGAVRERSVLLLCAALGSEGCQGLIGFS